MFGKKQENNAVASKETKNWFTDQYQLILVQRNWLLIITLITLIILILTVFALIKISSSKTFEPFLIEVDERSGIITTLESHSMEQYTAKVAIHKSYIARYVTAREGYEEGTYRYFYYMITRIFSAPEIWREFYDLIDKDNQKSPLNLGSHVVRRPFIKSIVFITKEKDLALVSFLVDEYDAFSKQKTKTNHYQATVAYKFIENMQLNVNERYFNPLGFQVTGYSRESVEVQNDPASRGGNNNENMLNNNLFLNNQ